MPRFTPILVLIAAMLLAGTPAARQRTDGYAALVALFEEFIAFERPPLKDGAPDHTAATLAAKAAGLKSLRSRLDAMDPAGWTRDQQVDHALVKALMNGL